MAQKHPQHLLKKCAEYRKANKLKIRAHLLLAGYTEKSLALEVGIPQQNINSVVNGLRHTPRILDVLRKAGVPEHLLFDPLLVAKNEKALN